MSELFINGDNENNKVSIYECQYFEDAWENLINRWFAESSSRSFDRLPRAIVLPDNSTIQFLKAYLLAEGHAIAGVHFFTPGILRKHLLSSYKNPCQLSLRENLHLIMQITADGLTNNPFANSAKIDPEPFTRLYDTLSTAGWSINVLKNKPLCGLLNAFEKNLKSSHLTTVQEIDRWLALEFLKQEKRFSNILVFGFRAKHWNLFNLLLAGVFSSKIAEVCLMSNDGSLLIEQAWLGSWEEYFGASTRLDSERFQRPFELLSSNLDTFISKAALFTKTSQIEIFISENLIEEAMVVVAKIAEILANDEPLRIGVVFPSQTSPVAREIARLLEQEKIIHYNHLGMISGPCKNEELFNAWIRWQASPRLSLFIKFLDQLYLEGKIHFEDIKIFKKLSSQAFQELLTDDWTIIRSYLSVFKFKSIEEILNTWILLPTNIAFGEFFESVKLPLKLIGWPNDFSLLEKRANTLPQVLIDNCSKTIFLSWLRKITKTLGRIHPSVGAMQHSLVHLITAEEAVTQQWSHLILVGLNRREWGGQSNNISFLDDDFISELNSKAVFEGWQGDGHLVVKNTMSLLLSGENQRTLSNANFVKLVALPLKKLFLTAHLNNATNEKAHFSSEYLEQVYWASTGNLLNETAINFIRKKTQNWISYYKKKLINEERSFQELTYAYLTRRDPLIPFNSYSFCFKKIPDGIMEFSCKTWEELILNPEKVWIEKILCIEKAVMPSIQSINAIAKGTWVHSWLQIPESPVKKQWSYPEWAHLINEKADIVFRKTIKTCLDASKQIPENWLSSWHQARNTALSLAKNLSNTIDSLYLFFEYNIAGIFPELKFFLHGRADLIGFAKSVLNSDEKSLLWILDFKTGTSGPLTNGKLKKGKGIQLALYALAFKSNGFNNVATSIIQPNTLPKIQLHMDEILENDQLFEALNKIYTTGTFGTRNVEYRHNSDLLCPLASIKIDNEIIEKKWRLTYPNINA